MIRILGRTGFDTRHTPRATFVERCEAWARHVLLGTPPTPGDTTRTSATPGTLRRAWGDLRRFVEAHRAEERELVDSGLGGLKSVVFGLVRGLRSVLEEDELIESRIEAHLDVIEQAMITGSYEQVQALVPNALAEVRAALSDRRRNVRDRIAALGARLSALREDLAATRRDAELDPLTQLYNRRAFGQAYERIVRLALAAAQPLTLAVVDVDHFKRVNDTYGHAAGDEVLRQIARTLIRTFPRKHDFVARFGGEEFVVLLQDVDSPTAARLTQRLQDNIRGLCVLHEKAAIRVTVSVGYALLDGEEDVSQLFERADQALYVAKKSGRDRAVEG